MKTLKLEKSNKSNSISGSSSHSQSQQNSFRDSITLQRIQQNEEKQFGVIQEHNENFTESDEEKEHHEENEDDFFHSIHNSNSMSKEKEEKFQISNKLLISGKSNLNKDGLFAITDDYNITGTNGILEIIPKIVKFRGFFLKSSQKYKVNITNISKFSQRVTILPPTTPFFTIKFSRRGLIPSGLSEVIIITFTGTEHK